MELAQKSSVETQKGLDQKFFQDTIMEKERLAQQCKILEDIIKELKVRVL